MKKKKNFFKKMKAKTVFSLFIFLFVSVFAIQYAGIKFSLAETSYGYGLTPDVTNSVVYVKDDRILNSRYPTQTKICSTYGDIGSRDTYGNEINRYLVKFDVSDLENSQISNVIFYIDRVSTTWDDNDEYYLHKVTSFWDKNSVNWDSSLEFDDNGIKGYYGDRGLFSFDITEMASEWVEDQGSNYGFIIKKANEDVSFDKNKGLFACSNYPTAGSETRPYVDIKIKQVDLVVGDIKFYTEWNSGENVVVASVCNRGTLDYMTDASYPLLTWGNKAISEAGTMEDSATVLRSGKCEEFNFTYLDDEKTEIYTVTLDPNNGVAESDESNNCLTKLVVNESVIDDICTDTDNGKDYYTRGFVAPLSDYCYGDILTEFYCDDGIQTIDYQCPNGCVDGACVKGSSVGLPDLTIKNAYFTPANPVVGELFNGQLHIILANEGSAGASAPGGFPVRVDLSSNFAGINWNNSGLEDIEGIFATDSETDVTFDINYVKFAKEDLEIRAWVDSNGLGIDDDLVNDDLYIDESDETNNTFFKKIILMTENISVYDYKMDKVAVNASETPEGYKISHLTVNAFDPMASNHGLAEPKEYLQQTIQSELYKSDRRYFTTGLRRYATPAEAVEVFENQNTMHNRTIIQLYGEELFGDEIFCHKSPEYTTLNTKVGQKDVYYYYCAFIYGNIFIDIQASVTSDTHENTLNLLKEYYYNLMNYDANRIPPYPDVVDDIDNDEDDDIDNNDDIDNDEDDDIDNNDEDDDIDNDEDNVAVEGEGFVDLATLLFEEKLDEVLDKLGELKDIVREQSVKIKYLEKLSGDLEKLSKKMENAINSFITYGVDANTKKLGEGERAAVVHSYKVAFNKLPETEEELADVIKIANGRWPSLTNKEAEKKAREQFEKIYKRIADMKNSQDNAAITVMAYGLRQKAENRNLDSERVGIKTFKHIYGYNPDSTADWNIMQAIAYSGSTRGVDSDGDLLTDEREVELGIDPNNPDTDGDGYNDGTEVANGYNPNGEGRLE